MESHSSLDWSRTDGKESSFLQAYSKTLLLIYETFPLTSSDDWRQVPLLVQIAAILISHQISIRSEILLQVAAMHRGTLLPLNYSGIVCTTLVDLRGRQAISEQLTASP